MRILILLVFLCGNVSIGKAQQNYFVYLQTDNKQPFYVRVNEKVFSSSASGYVVIPKLQNGTHVFSVGFPKNEWPQQVIPVAVANKDQGFILKNFDSKGWGLFNMQTLDVVMSNLKLSNSGTAATVTTRTDEFSNTLADVVNTPSIKEISKEETKVKETPKPVEPVIPVAETATADLPPVNSADVSVRDSSMLNPAPNDNSAAVAINDTVKSNSSVVGGSIKKVSESATAEALYISYLVQEGSSRDTIEVIIPVEATIVPSAEIQEPAPVKDSIGEVTIPEKKDTPADSNAPRFIDIELANPNNTTKDSVTAAIKTPAAQDKPNEPVAKVKEVPVKEQVTALKMINSDCKNTAGEADFLKIRKKMIAQKSEDQMINAAEKLFRQKCVSVEQVRNLSTLLLKQESKYKFFDTAYPFVYDTTEFRALEPELTDPYFLSRFRAMIRN